MSNLRRVEPYKYGKTRPVEFKEIKSNLTAERFFCWLAQYSDIYVAADGTKEERFSHFFCVARKLPSKSYKLINDVMSDRYFFDTLTGNNIDERYDAGAESGTLDVID